MMVGCVTQETVFTMILVLIQRVPKKISVIPTLLVVSVSFVALMHLRVNSLIIVFHKLFNLSQLPNVSMISLFAASILTGMPLLYLLTFKHE